MAFIAQVLLADVPALEDARDCLVSFHHCSNYPPCGSFGWEDTSNDGWPGMYPGYDPRRGYDIRFFENVSTRMADEQGSPTSVVVPAQTVKFRPVREVADVPDDAGVPSDEVPEDYPSLEDCPSASRTARADAPPIASVVAWVCRKECQG